MVTGPDHLYVTLLILLHGLTSESVKFEVLGPLEPIFAVAGDNIILPCYLKPNISVEDMTVDWLNLDFIDDRVYRYQNGKIIQEDQIPSYRGRTSLFKEELWRGNTSLKLTRVQGTDEGRYKCFIKSKDWYDDVSLRVLVKAVGSRPVVSIEGHREGGMGLVCQSEGWHPEPDLVWLDIKGVSLSAGPPETHRDLKGFYTVKQHVIVQETDTNLFTCRVQQRRINEELETEVHIPSELFDHTTSWVRSFIVSLSIGVIIVIVLALAVCCIHKKKGMKIHNLEQQLDVIIGELQQQQGYLMKKDFDDIRRHAVDVTLDPDTAHPYLILTEDCTHVCHGDTKLNFPDNPERFDSSGCVLGKEGFSSGRFYYEVQVKEKNWWTLGVARESVNRKGAIKVRPEYGYWTMRLRDGVYEALTDPSITLSLREKPQKVGVFVNYEKGQVSFFNVEARCHIYSFIGCTFNKKLYPFFCPGLNYGVKNATPLAICPVDVND
ncbi:butyrophilin subfamily 2 member A2-like isoform X2 [Esox lucius]|nr:butyrophilin subfamily 2 member A2-like isoform X2 [Esox lucius]